jgi:hypothetical protein
MKIPLLIAYLSSLSVIIPLVLAILQWRKLPADIAALRWLLLAALIGDGIMLSMYLLGKRNLVVGDIFMFIQFTILFYVFSQQFNNKLLLKTAYGTVLLFYLATLLFHESIPDSLIGSNGVDGILLIIVSIVLFYKLLSELKILNIHRLPILWIAFATLFYYSGGLFVFLSAGYLEGDTQALAWIWTVPNVLNIIKNLLFAIGLWQSYRTFRAVNE